MATELDDYMTNLKAETKSRYRNMIWNTVILVAVGAALAWWAYGTIAHTVLFAFIAFCAVAVKNSVEAEMHQFRASIESKMIMDRLKM